MISGLKGKLESLSSEWAIIDVNGIGFQVYMPTSTLSTLGKTGEEVRLYTHLYLREDNATLYGFASDDELRLFQSLISVSGLGPKLALALLSAMDAEKLTMAIATSSVDILCQVPGIGKKVAARLILELKSKIGAGILAATTAASVQENAEVLSALTSLGYSVAEATRAVATLPSPCDLSLEEKVRLALQYFGGK